MIRKSFRKDVTHYMWSCCFGNMWEGLLGCWTTCWQH